ncbi:hypothetical protein ACJMK2_002916 [Sinanodonta woodiana]|uniref:C-type lectin domain-containing protein n=1 Tax=Sinanodonta woodiana TaxID=1069815 RepID=A0ABD3XZY4_SINWO
MNLYDVLVICLTSIILGATASYFPVVIVYKDDNSSLFLFAAATSTLSTTSTTSTTTITPLRCSIGYTLYSGPGTRFCFRYSADCKSWDEARTACQMERADLASLDDQSLQPFSQVLRQHFPAENDCEVTSAVWLGAKTDNNRVAIYIDGQKIPSNSPLWVRGEPNTPGQCILSGFDGNNAFLLDRPCALNVKYVCRQL